MRIAGDEVERWCAKGIGRMSAGDLWIARGGGDGCDLTRLGFWRERLVELGF
jgi:hypothetical protein